MVGPERVHQAGCRADRPPSPYRFDPDATAAGLEAGVRATSRPAPRPATQVVVAGRLMLRRGQGKLAFGQLAGLHRAHPAVRPGRRHARLRRVRQALARRLDRRHRRGHDDPQGRAVGARSHEWTLLAETRRPFPDKWHGITDPDTRYRQRYVDLWVTDEARAHVPAAQPKLVSLTRRWLEDRGFIEVETPVFHPIPGGALAKPFTTHHNALDLELYLRIAPELYLKRLVVGGFERVFEIARVFRNEGISPRHNPEFTMLELYQAYADWTDIMELVEELVAYLAVELRGTTTVTYQGRDLDLSAPWRRATMTELIEEQIGVTRRPRHARSTSCGRCCDEHDVPWKDDYGAGQAHARALREDRRGRPVGPGVRHRVPRRRSRRSPGPHRELPA